MSGIVKSEQQQLQQQKRIKYSEWRQKVLNIQNIKLSKAELKVYLKDSYSKSVILQQLEHKKANAAAAEYDYYDALISQIQAVEFEDQEVAKEEEPQKVREEVKIEEAAEEAAEEISYNNPQEVLLFREGCPCCPKDSILQKYWRPFSDAMIIAGLTCALIDFAHAVELFL
jgi:hypothetical protein